MVSRRDVLKTGIGVSAAGLVGLSGCTDALGGGGNGNNSSGGGGGGTIRAATVFNQDHIQAQILERGVNNFIENAEGDYSLNLLAGSIGGEEDQMEAAASGSIDVHSTSYGGLANRYASGYGFLSAPFVAQGWEHLQAMEAEYVEGEDGLNSVLTEEGNQRVVRAAYRGVRHTTSNKPVTSPEDLEGVPMRMPEIDSWIGPWNAIGVDVTPVQADELYSALQTGVVEASEGPIGQFVDFSLYEVQSHFSKTGHMTQAYPQVVSTQFWDSLSDGDKETFNTAIDDAVSWGYETIQSEFEELEQMVQEEHDTTIVPAEEVDQQAFQEAAAPKIRQLFEENWNASYDDVQSLA
ncbi:TRAP transporter substrate-binding protein DctP [Halomarina salina]|uniref:TRAP transporter substrate-binding protein DctP n=1 Tax=Halomarina salina TaxID=1872699 RepID=A0ABD5RTC6_9EURY|nr:TRAP transporter substrate-binding protein DctP [Halomarina salina]